MKMVKLPQIARKKIRFNKILFLLLLPFIADVLVACCSCEEPVYFNYSHCELDVVNLDNSGAQAQQAGENVIKEAFGMRLTISRSSQVCQSRGLPSIFSTSAVAMFCSCNDNKYQYRESIRTVNITTINAFDETHPAGSDVTDLFRVFFDYNYYSVYEIGGLNRLFGSNPDYIKMDLLLMNPPATGGQFAFQIEMTLSDERILTAYSESVSLN